MEYVLIDSHQRFLGTFRAERMMSIGDIFQNTNAQTYAVIGINQARQRSRALQSLTVVRVNNRQPEQAAQ